MERERESEREAAHTPGYVGGRDQVQFSVGALVCQPRRVVEEKPAVVLGKGPGSRVQGAGCRVQGAGCRVQGAGCRVLG